MERENERPLSEHRFYFVLQKITVYRLLLIYSKYGDIQNQVQESLQSLITTGNENNHILDILYYHNMPAKREMEHSQLQHIQLIIVIEL